MIPTHYLYRQTNRLFAALLGVCVVFSPVAYAQIEEITVTARKRAESAQDVGRAINAFDSEALDRAGIQDVSRLELVTPGLAFAQRGNDFKLTLRGANAENTDRAEPVPIGVFVDGVYRLRSAQAGNAFLDVESVEVLKGPQGTLFGRNTLGGAVLIKTHKPSMEKNSLGMNFTYGNFDTKKVEGYGNLAISDNQAFRVAGSYTDAGGWIKNLGASNDLGEVDDVAVRASFLWDLSDSLSVSLSHFYYDSGGSALGAYGYQSRGTLRDPDPASSTPIRERMTHANGIHDPVNPRGGALGTRADLGPWEVYRDSPFIREVREDTTALEINWDLGRFSVKSLTSRTDYYNSALVDGDYSEGRLLQERRLDDQKSWSQEIQFTSNTDGDLDWVLGGYFASEKFNQAFYRNWLGFAVTPEELDRYNSETETLSDADILDGCNEAFIAEPRAALQTEVQDEMGNAITSCPGQFAGNPSDLESDTIGVFLHGSYQFTERARANAGVRYSADSMDYLRGRTFRSTNTAGVVNHTATNPEADGSWDQVTWEVGLEADVFEDSLFYFNVSTGFLAGSFNPDGSTFDQQEVMAYEVGLKNLLFDNRLELNLSAYRNEFTDLLAGVLDAQSVTQKVNGGSINTNGIELDLKALPMDNLVIVANMAWQDSDYDSFGTNNRFQIGGLDPGNFIDLSGQETPWAPDLAGNLSVSYDIHAGAAGTVTPHMQLSYSGAHWTTGLQQFPLARQEAYAKLDLRLYWESADGAWNAQAFIENVTDYAVLQHTIVGGSDIVQVSWGKPRMYGLKVGYRFN